MNKGDRLAAGAFYGGGGGDACALKTNIAAVARVDARQHFDQRRFAGAVFAQ